MGPTEPTPTARSPTEPLPEDTSPTASLPTVPTPLPPLPPSPTKRNPSIPPSHLMEPKGCVSPKPFIIPLLCRVPTVVPAVPWSSIHGRPRDRVRVPSVQKTHVSLASADRLAAQSPFHALSCAGVGHLSFLRLYFAG